MRLVARSRYFLPGGWETECAYQLSERHVRAKPCERPPAACPRRVGNDGGAGGLDPGESLLDLVEPRPSAPADVDPDGSFPKDTPDRAAEVEAERESLSHPARTSSLGGGLHIGNAASPIDVCHLPAPASEQEHDRSVAADLKRQRMHEAELRPSVVHGEQRLAGEHRHQLHEVPAAERELSLDAHRHHPFVVVHDAAHQHELDDVVEMLARHRAKSRHLTQPLAPRCVSYASFLQGESQELLREDVKRLRWWHDGFDVAIVPESQQAGRSQESVVGGCQE